MSKILVFTEAVNGKIKRSSQELLQFAAKNGNAVCALVLDSAADSIAVEAAHHGEPKFFSAKILHLFLTIPNCSQQLYRKRFKNLVLL